MEGERFGFGRGLETAQTGGVGVVHTAIVAVFVVAAASALAARFRLVDVSGFVLAVGVLASAEVVGLSTLLSMFHWFSAGGITAGTAAIVVASGLVWWRGGAPRPTLRLGDWGSGCRRHPAVAVLLGVVGAALGFQLFMGLRLPPNETDALLYHLPRAVTWMHRHSVLQFHPGARADPQVNNPINGELFVAWTMALSHADRLANTVQWCFAVAVGGAVAAGARLLGFPRSAALLAASGFLLFPEVLLQSATPQVDLIITFFIAATAVFAVRGLRHARATEFVVAGIAFGLAVGTKESALFAVPPLAVMGAACWWRYGTALRMLLVGAAATAAGVAAFGSVNYVQNLVNTGEVSGGQNASVAGDFVRAGTVRNLARVSSTFVDAPGLPQASTAARLLHPIAARVVGTIHGPYYATPPAITTTVDDDTSGYGLLGLLVLVPVVSVALLRGPPPQRVVALAGASYLVIFAARLGYSPEVPRLLLPAAALVSPLLARVDDHRWRRRTMVAVALAGVVPALTLNTNKPLLLRGTRSVLRDDRIETQLVSEPRYVAAVEALNRLIPAEGELGVVDVGDNLDYVLYDPGLHRDVVVLSPADLNPLVLRRRGFLGAFVWQVSRDHCPPTDCPGIPTPSGALPLPGGAAFLPAAHDDNAGGLSPTDHHG